MISKLFEFMGYNNLSLILSQERKHWLMKTDKKKQLQDRYTGNVYQGQVDNLGSDIILQTEKLPIKNDIVSSLTFNDEGLNDILSPYSSTFPYSSGMNGLMFERIISIEYPVTIANSTEYKNYKLKFVDCEKCIIPLGGGLNSSDVFAGEWIKTTTNPSIIMMDADGEYTIEVELKFNDNITNPTFYYPLTTTLQPLNLVHESDKVYVTAAVNDNGYIGYPLYWFTCDQTVVGTVLNISENNYSPDNEQIFYVCNPGNNSKYDAVIYTGIAGENDATPDGTATSNYSIIVNCNDDTTFTNNDDDYKVPLNITTIRLYNESTLIEYNLNMSFSNDGNNFVYMLKSDVISWTYVDSSTYKISLSLYDVNSLSISTSPLYGTFIIKYDETIPMTNTTTDIGYAGIRMSAANKYSDIYGRYPHQLNEWDGLPEWMNDLSEDNVPEHMAIYAIHNTPEYVETIPDSRQVAALLIDPGKLKTEDHEGLTNDEKGRIYVLSNDAAEYVNNANADFPKPERTVARICDIPTSITQLTGISGIAPISVVDKNYVRSTASYSESDKNRLYNIIKDIWVRPIHENSNGARVVDTNASETNEFVFNTLDGLNSVDLINHNDFRYLTNINPVVNPMNVKLSAIINSGSGYIVNDIGVVYVGGFAFNYLVTEIDTDGGVTALTIIPMDENEINLSNFNMSAAGITEAYGTSPLPRTGETGAGSGLKFSFQITDYEDIITKQDEIYEDLYALVKMNDGVWIYNYVINSKSSNKPKVGVWTKTIQISKFEINSSATGLSMTEAYMNSIVSAYKKIPITYQINNKSQTTLEAMTTASFINIIDKNASPITPVKTSSYDEYADITRVDMCKFYCDGIVQVPHKKDNGQPVMKTRNVSGVISALKELNVLQYDSYVIWQWLEPNNTANYGFKYGIVKRSLNNFLSTDTVTTLPNNDLTYKSYVNSNPSTTVVWDVDSFGVMLWTYNPSYQYKETYSIDTETDDIYMDKTQFTWEDIDIRNNNNNQVVLTSEGKLLWGVLTNNPIQSTITSNTVIYQQPDFIELISPNTYLSSIPITKQPMGSWQLVYPRINSYEFKDTTSGVTLKAVKLGTIRTSTSLVKPIITDADGNIVNSKHLLIDESSSTAKLKIYNTNTGNWDTI